MPIDQETIENAMAYVEWKAGSLKQKHGKWKAVQAARMQRKLLKSFGKQLEWIVAKAEKLSFFNDKQIVARIERKTVRQEIKQMLDDLPENEDIADIVGDGGKGAYVKGGKAGYDQFGMGAVNIDFDLVNVGAVEYMKRKKTLHLSDYKGSIQTTTKKRILNILTDAAETGASYQDTGRKIRLQAEEGVFSQFRAEMIATNEIGHAYGSGNHDIVELYIKETGVIIEKYWITVQDDRVTEECAANEAAGWIGYDEQFNSGDDIAPRNTNPRCRCDTGYRVVDSQGNGV